MRDENGRVLSSIILAKRSSNFPQYVYRPNWVVFKTAEQSGSMREMDYMRPNQNRNPFKTMASSVIPLANPPIRGIRAAGEVSSV